jgi:RNA polymerase sigma-70 factor, ECF subfamily
LNPDLISRARQGDDSAYEILVRQHQEAVFRLAYLLMGDPDEAEDITQDTFIRAHQALSRFDLERPFRPWLLSIATNLTRNRRRALGRYFAALRRSLLADPSQNDPKQSDEALYMHRWQNQELWAAVRRLDASDQEIIYLRYFLDLPSAETAQTLGVAEGTVKSRLHRALGRLRTLVKNEFPGLGEERTE